MKLQIFYPFRKFFITQEWGNPNGAYATQFNDPNFKRHNGIDARPQYGPTDYPAKYPVYCPVENFYVEKVLYAPQGGGNEIHLRSNTKVTIGDVECHAWLILCHADKILVPAGYEPALGEVIMIGDNTGFSTGPHTHIGLYRIGDNGFKLDDNDATGSYNPYPFFTLQYAADKASIATIVKSGLRLAKYYAGL